MIEPQNILLVGGLLLITMWLMIRLRRKRYDAATRPTAREQLDQNRQARGMRGDLEQVMVEVEQLARRFSAQLDAKTMQLNKLIEQADERIAELKRLESDASSPPERDPTPPSDVPETQATETESQLAESVYQLADAGNNPIEIARSLNEHVGKVELILALRDK